MREDVPVYAAIFYEFKQFPSSPDLRSGLYPSEGVTWVVLLYTAAESYFWSCWVPLSISYLKMQYEATYYE